jgi:hypothetical protein
VNVRTHLAAAALALVAAAAPARAAVDPPAFCLQLWGDLVSYRQDVAPGQQVVVTGTVADCGTDDLAITPSVASLAPVTQADPAIGWVVSVSQPSTLAAGHSRQVEVVLQ